MISTATAGNHALWDQVVRKEADAKRRFEFITGDTQAKKFFSGSLKNSVEGKLQTYGNLRTIQPELYQSAFHKTPNANASKSRMAPLNKRASQKSMEGLDKRSRYSSASKADALSQALQNVLSDKRTQVSSKRGSSTVSKSMKPMPFMNSTANARTVRDIDS